MMYAMNGIVLMIFANVLLAHGDVESSPTTNSTKSPAETLEDDVDDLLENMNFTEFKERYRRLIPYRTLHLSNNHVNSQLSVIANQNQKRQQHQSQQHQQSYDRMTASSTYPLTIKPQRPASPPSRLIDKRRKPNVRINSSNMAAILNNKPTDKFVPSVQYDPKNMSPESDYFTPLASKLHYDRVEYTKASSANRYEAPRPRRPIIYREPVIPVVADSHRDILGHYPTDRSPSRPIADHHYSRKYLPNDRKTPLASLQQDYPSDYGTGHFNDKIPSANLDYNYPTDDYEHVRYVNIEPPSSSTIRQSKPTRILAQSNRQSNKQSSSMYLTQTSNVHINDIMKSLRLTNTLPEMLNRDNIDSSIKTLIEILRILNNAQQTDVEKLPVKVLPDVIDHGDYRGVQGRPKVVTETRFQATPRPQIVDDENVYDEPERYYNNNNDNYDGVNSVKDKHLVQYYTPLVQDIDDEIKQENYGGPTIRPPVKVDDYDLRDYEGANDHSVTNEGQYDLGRTTETPVSKFQAPDGASSHEQLVPPTTLKYGATRGKANVDYPAYATIPKTEFNCKEQRYKGFFGDPTTGCQVWHYCDLNGGKSSFLCPNGTIFSQVALTCDWWFNVKCEFTPQLYVLNERLYKYILPIIPKFPEDFSGPEVDRYLEIKFKEMEAKLKEKKLKKQQEKDRVKEKLQSLDSEN